MQIASMQSCGKFVVLFIVGFVAQVATAAVPIPLPGEIPVDLLKLKTDNPAVISTNGNWLFQLTSGAMVDGHFIHQAASASSSQAEQSPGNAVDGKDETRWCADGDTLPQWWQIDLGTIETVTGMDIAWEYHDGHYQYRIETGPDEAHLKVVCDRTLGEATPVGPVEWPAEKARFVRVTVVGATDVDGNKKWASIREVHISVVHEGKTVAWSAPAADRAGEHDDDFAAVGYDDRNWHEMVVPSNWEVLGYSKPTYFGPDTAAGLYRRQIEIPANFSDKKVLWHFDGVTDSAEVWVNGKRVGYHEGGFTAFDIDLTSAIKPGQKNLLAVRVCKTTPTVDLDTGDYWLLGGIHRDSYIVALPSDHVEDLTVVTRLDDHYSNATLLADAVVRTQADHAWEASAKLFKADGSKLDAKLSVIQQAQSTGTKLHVEGFIFAPALWSAEKPNLYYLLITLREGDHVVETVQQRFGFRQMDIKDGVLLWNGVPIKCCGTCRHEEWAALGHALTEHEWQTDIAMMKAANINAVRTSHYNHAERFLELCDEKGLYVLDEIPACWVSNKDPKLTAAFIQHATETLSRDKNKPSVLAWSCGNESGWGPNFKAMVDYVAATDPTRPRFVSEQSKSKDPDLTISDHHYPQDSNLRTITTTETGPSVITEGPHIFYNIGHQAYDYGLNDLWGMALASQWDRVWPSKPLFGAFIWEWQDQGLADKSPDRSDVDANGLRRENSKGIVTGFRVPKPEYYHVKMVYSPVTTEQREVRTDGKNWSVEFKNRYAFTDLSELTCQWQAMTTIDSDHAIEHGAVVASCPPGQSKVIEFPITVQADTLRVSFVDRNGVEVYAVRLSVPGTLQPQPPSTVASGEIKAVETPDTVGMTSAALGVSIDRATGLVSIKRGSDKLLSGPTLNLGELRADDGDFGNKNDAPWIGSKSAPVLKNARVSGGLTGPELKAWNGSVTAEVTLAENPKHVLGLLNYYITVQPGGHIDWSYRLKWTAEDMQAWELGLKFDLPGDDTFSWFRKGQWTEYPAGHIGANRGSVTHEDRSFASTKRDTIWATVRTQSGDGIAICSADSPLHTRCNFHDGITTLFASAAVSVDRDFSSGYVDETRIIFKQGHTYEGAFGSWLLTGKP